MRQSSLILLVIATCFLLFVSPCAAADEAIDRARLEKMLVSSHDDGLIISVFRRHPGQTLPFIDHYLEGALAAIEKGGTEMDASRSFATGIGFAGLADRAFECTTFSDYANAFASWSPSERKEFREGQRLFKEGMKAAKDDAAKSRKLLRQSLRRADKLGDLWGQAMAHGAIASSLATGSGDDLTAGYLASIRAVELNGQLRLQDDLVEALRVQARLLEARNQAQGAASSLMRAWELVERDDSFDDATRTALLAECVSVLEKTGNKGAADSLRKRDQEARSDRAPDDAKSPPAPAK